MLSPGVRNLGDTFPLTSNTSVSESLFQGRGKKWLYPLSYFLWFSIRVINNNQKVSTILFWQYYCYDHRYCNSALIKEGRRISWLRLACVIIMTADTIFCAPKHLNSLALCISGVVVSVRAWEPMVPGSNPWHPLTTFQYLILLLCGQRLPKLLPYFPQMGLTMLICIWGCSSNKLHTFSTHSRENINIRGVTIKILKPTPNNRHKAVHLSLHKKPTGTNGFWYRKKIRKA